MMNLDCLVSVVIGVSALLLFIDIWHTISPITNTRRIRSTKKFLVISYYFLFHKYANRLKTP